jgi:hypothetical protein
MQLFNDVINRILSELESYSLKINEIIKSDNNYDYTDDLGNLYFERGKIIEDFLESKKSNDWKIYISHYNEYFSEYINKIQKIEKDNIRLINGQITNISDNIKNLMKQKSLLIYMKTEL